MTDKIVPILLAGGSGTRLWPLSRSEFPKQLLAVLNDATMLQTTARRVHSRAGFAAPIVVTSERLRFIVADQLADAGIAPSAILLEPAGRNTAPAIALAALEALRADPEAILLVMPSDHVIAKEAALHTAIRTLLPAVRNGALATFGIEPTRAETAFGYIRTGNERTDAPGSFEVSAFVEKPDAETAERYLTSRDYLWNGGIFLFRARTYLEALAEYAPQIGERAEEAMEAATREGSWIRPGKDAFLRCPDLSIDYAVMEKTRKAAVVRVDMGWSDVGSWDAVWELASRNDRGTATHGAVTEIETQNCLLRSEAGPRIVAFGIKEIVAVGTRDAILIMPRDRAQDVRAVVETLKSTEPGLQSELAVVHRPWGTYETTDKGDRFLTKRIVVKPGAKLSLQRHRHRSEHWIVVSGTAKVTIDGSETILRENESTYIPVGSIHRLENPGPTPLHLIEVQCGSYLSEDDIVRLNGR